MGNVAHLDLFSVFWFRGHFAFTVVHYQRHTVDWELFGVAWDSEAGLTVTLANKRVTRGGLV
jgi:hypothetical protein